MASVDGSSSLETVGARVSRPLLGLGGALMIAATYDLVRGGDLGLLMVPGFATVVVGLFSLRW